MKNFLFLSAVLLTGLMACQPKQSLSIKIDSSGFDEFWTALDDSSKAVITSRVLRENGCLAISREAQMEMAGTELTPEQASAYTQNYYGSFTGGLRDSLTKSVYFSLTQIQAIYDKILTNCSYPENDPGIRIYFARYDQGTPANNQIQTVVLRATCNYADISHYDASNNQLKVAWNYGDPCPPRCKENQDASMICTGGEYRTDGPFRVNCQ